MPPGPPPPTKFSCYETHYVKWLVPDNFLPLLQYTTKKAPVVTVFPRFLLMATINFSACQDMGTIRGWELNEGGVIITQQ